jgi:hypothetical protein
MIGNIVKGAGFGGACRYTEEKDGAKVLDSNMAANDPDSRAREFQAIASQNPRCKKPVFHASLSAPAGEKLTDEQWAKVGQAYLKGMGFDDHQYCVTRHTDAEHDHIHIIANRVKQSDFAVVKDSNDRQHSQEVLRGIEKEHGLQVVEKNHGKSQEDGQAAMMRKLIGEATMAAHGKQSVFLKELDARGIKPILNKSKSTCLITGISYQLDDGKVIKGSQLGKTYSWHGVQNRITKAEERRQGLNKVSFPRNFVFQ